MNSSFAYSAQSALCTGLPAARRAHCSDIIDSSACPIGGLDRDALFAEFVPLIYRLIRQYGQSTEMRQEMPGELYCRFQALLDSYDPERGVPLRPYLVRQLTAGAYAFARKQWTQTQREAPLVDGMESGFRTPASDPTSEWDAVLEHRKLAATLPDMIAELPARQRQVMVWRYYDEKSFEEIARLLGVQEASVRSLLRHGMNRLRQRVTTN